MRNRRIVFEPLVVLFLLGTLPGLSPAGEAWRSHTELLPSYCKYRVTPEGKANRSGRYPALKPVWIHIHHYCAGIYAEVKAKTGFDSRKKRTYLKEVVDQMAYVAQNCGPNCVLFPELHTRWGWALQEQGKISEAIRHYDMAIRVKPGYSRAYAQLADLLVETGQVDEARKVLEKGLEAKPNSWMLKRRLEELPSSSKPAEPAASGS